MVERGSKWSHTVIIIIVDNTVICVYKVLKCQKKSCHQLDTDVLFWPQRTNMAEAEVQKPAGDLTVSVHPVYPVHGGHRKALSPIIK